MRIDPLDSHRGPIIFPYGAPHTSRLMAPLAYRLFGQRYVHWGPPRFPLEAHKFRGWSPPSPRPEAEQASVLGIN